MKIKSKNHGAIEISEKQIISFEEGLYGFESLRKFALLDSKYPPLYYLQSIEEERTAFIILQINLFLPEYDSLPSDIDYKKIGLSKASELLQFSIITIRPDSLTANLQGPLAINKHTKQGIQYITKDDKWSLHFSLAAEMVEA